MKKAAKKKASAGYAERATMSQPMMRRMVEIHREIGRAPRKKVNCTTLAEQLEVGRKTVLRDIVMMRDELGMPIGYDGQRHTYFYLHPVDHLPLFHPSEGEMLALFVAERALGGLEGTAMAERVRSALRKIAAAMQDEVSLSLEDMADGISFRRGGVARHDAEVFGKLERAVRTRCEVALGYRKLNATKDSVRHVEPYHLAEIGGAWYVIGRDRKRSALRTFALARVSRVEVRARKFERPADFSLGEHLRDSFGVFAGAEDGERREVRLHFDAFAAQLVRERDWHASQQIRELPRGELELRLTLDRMEEIQRWVLSWGVHATVLEPRELKRMVKSKRLR